MKNKNWFTEWFNTPYYHILYKHRDDKDAQFFMRNLTAFLKLPKSAHILDLPCGKGRHAVYLNSLGYKVTGKDLSEKSIQHAKQFENDRLHFKVHDMRKPFQNQYDAVFNLFTSFGYFDDSSEDTLVLSNIKNSLKPNGLFVFDFLNAEKLKITLVEEEEKIIDDIHFQIQREIKNGFIFKHIYFTVDGKNQHFTERVKLLDLEKMNQYFEATGFQIETIFGDYSLNSYDPVSSNRLIIIAK